MCLIGLSHNISFTTPFIDSRVLKLTAMFFTGSLIKTLHLSRKILKRFFFILLVLFFTKSWIAFSALSVFIELLIVGTAILLVVEQKKFVVKLRNDISYGIYIYAFVIQQMLFQLFNYQMSPILNTVLTLATTIPIAFLSWKFIEEPALQLKQKFTKSSALS